MYVISLPHAFISIPLNQIHLTSLHDSETWTSNSDWALAGEREGEAPEQASIFLKFCRSTTPRQRRACPCMRICCTSSRAFAAFARGTAAGPQSCGLRPSTIFFASDVRFFLFLCYWFSAQLLYPPHSPKHNRIDEERKGIDFISDGDRRAHDRAAVTGATGPNEDARAAPGDCAQSDACRQTGAARAGAWQRQQHGKSICRV